MSKTSNHTLQVGAVLNNKWVVLEFLGKGAMGEVYRAHQLKLKRDVGLKVISPLLLRSLYDDDEEEIQASFLRFRREVEAMAQVRHPNVVQIFDHGVASVKRGEEDIAVEYVAMEYIPGGTLRSTMSEDGFYPDAEATRTWLVEYLLPTLDGVKAIHDLGIVHRDMKPENVLIDGNTPKVVDFGLARSVRMKPVTESIDAKGTPGYMSPEHFFDFRRADQQADIYSLGKILFEAIDGKMSSETIPFRPAKLEKADTPFFHKLDQIIVDATAEDRKERIDSVEELRHALLEAIAISEKEEVSAISTPTKAYSVLAQHRLIWAGIVIAVVSVGLMTVWHLVGEPGKSNVVLKSLSVEQVKAPQRGTQTPSEPVGSPKMPAAQPTIAEDGVTLRFVPGGTISFPDDFGPRSGQQVEVPPFYMDETLVTNYQYVNFLNEVSAKIRVDKAVVRGNGEIWMLLGEVVAGYEPIIFKDDGFKINKAADAACPVLRITPYGASAYARFYERRVPSDAEWLFVVKHGALPKQNVPKEIQEPSEMMMEMGETHHRWMPEEAPFSRPQYSDGAQIHLPVEVSEPNGFGIRV